MAMGQLDWGLVSSLLELTPNKVMAVDVDASFLVDEAALGAFNFIHLHITETGKVPARAVVAERFPALQTPDAARDQVAVEWVVRELRKRKTFALVQRGLSDAVGELKVQSPEAALEVVDRMIRDVEAVRQKIKVHDIQQIGDKLIQLYEDIKSGKMGVEFPWRSLNLMTRGMWPETVTFFAARPGTGKTFVVIICARHGHLNGHRVLIVSPEMNSLEMGERFFAIEGGVAYSDVISGSLGQVAGPDGISAEQRYVTAINSQIGPGPGPWIVDDEDRLTAPALEATIAALQPDLLAVDAAYLLRIGKGSRYERIIEIVEWLRYVAKKFHMAVAATSQLTKEAEKKGVVGQLTVALTDTINWDAHNLFALKQTPEMREDNKLAIHPVKVRRLARAYGKNAVDINWDMERMDFDEVEERDEFKDGGSSDPYAKKGSRGDDDMPF